MKSEKNTGDTVVMPQSGESAGSFLQHIWASIAFTVTGDGVLRTYSNLALDRVAVVNS